MITLTQNPTVDTKERQLPEDQEQILSDIHKRWGKVVPLSAVQEMFGDDHGLSVAEGGVSDFDVLNAILIARQAAISADPR